MWQKEFSDIQLKARQSSNSNTIKMKIQRQKTDLENKEKDNEKGKDCKEQSNVRKV